AAGWVKLEQHAQEGKARFREVQRDGDAQERLEQVIVALRHSRAQEAREVLKGVEGRLAEGGSAELQVRVEACQRALAFLEKRETIPQLRAQSVVEGKLNDGGVALAYSTAFETYGIDVTDRATAAATIRESPVRVELLATLDSWAQVEQLGGTRRKLLQVAYLA